MNETLQRAISGTVYVALLLACILHSSFTFYILFGIFLILTIHEFSKLVKINKWTSLLLGIIIYSWAYQTQFNPILDACITLFCISIALKLIAFLFSNQKTNLYSYEKWMYLLGYIILPFLILNKIPLGIKGYNPKILIGIFILIWTNDTFAFIVGKSIGKHKLFERISPKKTIEGFLGGLIFSILTGIVIAKFIIETSNTHIWIGIAVLVSIFATLGDLIQSKFKRIAGVKDSGTIMPGHGGILDRLDSIIFVAPFIYLFYQILNYVS
ncbi:phosphatidate cytidylyltransferase [Flavobacterium sp.]|uniref:phosphatidate cytidylyltransferase n=1 Tax=Flavobacterium sp. TaxID=239 RepID=UPI002FDB30D6